MLAIDRPKITRPGLQAIAAAEAQGKKISFVGLALGTASYNPTGDETGLKAQRELAAIADSKPISGARVHLTGAFTSEDIEPYDVGELGILAKLEGVEAPITFAILSKAETVIAKRIPKEELLLGVDILIAELPANLITVDGVGERLNLSMAQELASVALSLTSGQRQTLELMRDLAAARSEMAAFRSEMLARISDLEAFQSRTSPVLGSLATPGKLKVIARKVLRRDESPSPGEINLKFRKMTSRPLRVGFWGAYFKLSQPNVAEIFVYCEIGQTSPEAGAAVYQRKKLAALEQGQGRFRFAFDEFIFVFDGTPTSPPGLPEDRDNAARQLAILNAPGDKELSIAIGHYESPNTLGDLEYPDNTAEEASLYIME